MSYYQKSNYIVTNHAICRAKQRIKEWAIFDDFQIRIKINNFLTQCNGPDFSDSNYDYYHFNNSQNKYLYFIVNKNNGLVISLTPISHHKKIHIFS